MPSTDDVLEQIDNAVDDWAVSADAMRCTPPSDATPGPGPERPRAGDPGLFFAREILARRLVDNHDLPRATARLAVIAFEQGRPTPHTDLVLAEARAEAEQLRAFFAQVCEAFKPVIEGWTRVLRQLGEQLRAAGIAAADATDGISGPGPTQRRDRPAWQSPYGPRPRRRR